MEMQLNQSPIYLIQFVKNLKSIGINVIGEAFDGDPCCISRTFTFAQDICDKIHENFYLALEELAYHAW